MSVEDDLAYAKDPQARILIGAAVRKERKKRGLSRKELAYKSGVGEETISNIENGKARPRPWVTVAVVSWLSPEGTVKEFIDRVLGKPEGGG